MFLTPVTFSRDGMSQRQLECKNRSSRSDHLIIFTFQSQLCSNNSLQKHSYERGGWEHCQLLTLTLGFLLGAWRGGLKMRSYSRFLMTSRPSVAFSINLQIPLLLGTHVTSPAQRRWLSLGLTHTETLLQKTLGLALDRTTQCFVLV